VLVERRLEQHMGLARAALHGPATNEVEERLARIEWMLDEIASRRASP